MVCRQLCAKPLQADSLLCHGRSHLPLWFESKWSVTAHAGGAFLSCNAFSRKTLGWLAMNSAAIRDTIKAQRNALSPDDVVDASIDISRHLWNLPVLSRARRIACYFPVGHEVDCRFFISSAWERGRTVLLPVLWGPELKFATYDSGTTFLRNQHDIPEPAGKKSHQAKPQEIDVVLAPLVAFDTTGNRIGMGGGYYDRSFRFMRSRTTWHRPALIGLAYDFQKVPQIKAHSWDIPLQFVVTEKNIYRF